MYNDYHISVYELLCYLKMRSIIKDDIEIDDVISDLNTKFSYNNQLINYKCYGPNTGLIKINTQAITNKNTRCCVCRINMKYNFLEIVNHLESEMHIKNLIKEIAKNFEYDEDIKANIIKLKMSNLFNDIDKEMLKKLINENSNNLYCSPYINYLLLAENLKSKKL